MVEIPVNQGNITVTVTEQNVHFTDGFEMFSTHELSNAQREHKIIVHGIENIKIITDLAIVSSVLADNIMEFNKHISESLTHFGDLENVPTSMRSLIPSYMERLDMITAEVVTSQLMLYVLKSLAENTGPDVLFLLPSNLDLDKVTTTNNKVVDIVKTLSDKWNVFEEETNG